MATYLDHDHDRQQQLLSTSIIGRSESVSLWKKISGTVKDSLRHLPCEWLREKQEDSPVNGLTGALLVKAYLSLTKEEIDQTIEDEGTERYDEWRKSYELLFKHCERTSFTPMDDATIISSSPWYPHYTCDYQIDPNCQIDLREKRGREIVSLDQPSIKRVRLD